MLLNFLNNRKRVIIFSAVTVVALITAFFVFFTLDSDRIYKGIEAEGVNLSGLKREEAKYLIASKIERNFGMHKIVLRYGDNFWTIDPDEIAINYLVDDTVDEAYCIGRKGNVIKRIYSIFNTRRKGAFLYVDVEFNRLLLGSFLSDIKKQIEKKEKSATANYENGSVSFVKEEIGRILNIDENLEMIENSIVSRKFADIYLIVREKYPEITIDGIKEIRGVIGSFSTTFNPNDKNRSYNIGLASKRISGTVVLPGKVFSMNEALGPRTTENGYKEATVIFKNELVKGTGGGVCQVSSTLYNAVLKSKLKVCERTHHSIPLGYVSKGLDATIAEDYIDFKFMNDTDYPVCISASVKSNSVYIRILGRDCDNGLSVVLKSVVVRELEAQGEEVIVDDSVPDNERVVLREARKGYKVVVYRETYNKSGELIDKEKISEDTYLPAKAQIKVNSSYNKEIDNTF